MGNETIFYYIFEETITGCRRCVKTHFWKKIKPLSFVLEEDGITIVTVMIPEINKGWKREKLLKVMQESMEEGLGYIGGGEVIVHSELQKFLTQQDSLPESDEFLRPDDFSPIFWDLADKLFIDKFESVVLLMSSFFFPEEQMQRFTKKLQPYFPRVNKLIIIYEMDGNNRWEEAIDNCLEMLYYEYGLVGQVICNASSKEKYPNIGSGQGNTLFLDYGYKGKLPYGMMRNGGTYIDLLSSDEKERRINKKCPKISYFSPRKYLDTMVKSGYDKLVNQK